MSAGREVRALSLRRQPPVTTAKIDFSQAGRETSASVQRGTKTMFAVIKTGGKQYRVAEDQYLQIEKIQGEPGQIVQLGNVLMLGGETTQLGTPTIAGASVAAEVVSQGRGPKVIAFKKRRRKNSRRKRGHRQEFTLIRVTEILTDGKAPTKAAQPRAVPKPKPQATAEGEAKPKAAKPKPAKAKSGKASSKSKAGAAKGKKK
jgi:large subunit ribosomal protein L21